MAYFTPRAGAGTARGTLGDVGRGIGTRHRGQISNPPPSPFPKPPAFFDRGPTTRHAGALHNPPPSPFPKPLALRGNPLRFTDYLSPRLDPPTHDRRGSLGAYGTLGDDAPAPVEMTEAQYRTAMLASQHEMVAWQERWVKRDELQRWMQFGATLAIPLSAAIWRAIFKGARES